jgi:hypothetical protein
MRKHLNQLFMFVMIFTTLFFTINCSKVDDGIKNLSPDKPTNPTPSHNAIDVPTNVTLGWSDCADPENDPVTYDIYLGTTFPPFLVKSNSLLNSFATDTLLPGTKYYWKVVAKDDKLNSAASSIWNFTTVAGSTRGDLRVVTCDATQTNFFGGTEVFLYKSDAERTSDPMRSNYFRKTTTDNSNPIDIGAIFYDLADQKYYVFARHDLGGANFIQGVGESFVPAGVVTKLIVSMN